MPYKCFADSKMNRISFKRNVRSANWAYLLYTSDLY